MQEETYKVKLTLEDQFIVEPEVEQTLVRILMLKGEKGDKGDAGEGDMNKSVYDTNDDGKVNAADNADTVNNHTVNDDVPADFFSGDATATAEGTDITLTDALALKSVDLKGDTFQQTLSGKNLYNATDRTQSRANLTETILDNKITIDGTATRNNFGGTYFNINGTENTNANYYNFDTTTSGTTLSAGTYTLSLKNETGSYTTPSRILFYVTKVYSGSTPNTTISTMEITNDVTYTTFTLTEETTVKIQLQIYISSDTEVDVPVFNNYSFNLQLELGSTPTTYEPYVGGIPSPNPDYPQDIDVVTGEQTVTISDGVNSDDFTVDLGSIELCKIGTYQDYIYKSGDDWYVHKESGKTLVTGSSSESWLTQTSNVGYMYRLTLSGVASNPAAEMANLRSDYFTPTTGQQIYNVTGGGYISQLAAAGYIRFNIGDTTDKLSDFKTWLSTHNTTVYYALATATDTKITDSTLIGELNAVWHAYMYNGTTSLASSGTLPAILSVEAFNKNANGIAEAIKTINSGL